MKKGRQLEVIKGQNATAATRSQNTSCHPSHIKLKRTSCKRRQTKSQMCTANNSNITEPHQLQMTTTPASSPTKNQTYNATKTTLQHIVANGDRFYRQTGYQIREAFPALWTRIVNQAFWKNHPMWRTSSVFKPTDRDKVGFTLFWFCFW